MNISTFSITKMYVKCSYIKKLDNKQHQYYIVHNSIKPIAKEIQDFILLHGIMNALIFSNETLCQCCCYLILLVWFGNQLLSQLK